MIRALFLWFYCLPIPQVVLAVVLATVCYLMLSHRYDTTVFWKNAIWFGCFVWLCFILAITVKERPATIAPSAPLLIPFHSYATVWHGGTTEILRSNFMNVLLFYPAGLMIYSVLLRRWKQWQRLLLIALLGMVISTGVEFSQYYYCVGIAEIDDVIHNTSGMVLGALPHLLVKQLINHK